ncbi:MAG: hypothetical protein ACE5D6_05930, partial [Candidatus Zixiibacteriota bacterium]
MKKQLQIVMLITLLTAAITNASVAYTISSDSIYKHISILADDSLEGREVGEIGEWKAALYIQEIFKSAQLEPKGLNRSYLQDFEFIKRIDFGENNNLKINSEKLLLKEEFLPMKQSASGKFEFNEIID